MKEEDQGLTTEDANFHPILCVQYGTSLSLFCCTGCARVWSLSDWPSPKRKLSDFPWKWVDSDSVGSRERIQESNCSPWGLSTKLPDLSRLFCSCFPEFFWSCVWKLSQFLLVSLPIGLDFNFLSTLLSQSPFSCFQNVDIVCYWSVSFSSCLCGFKPFEYSFIAISGESLERVELEFPIHCVSFISFLNFFYPLFRYMSFENSI